MKTRLKSDRIVLRDSLFDGYVYVSDGKIAGVSAKAAPADEEYDFTGLFLSPGFIDIHTHGGGGHAFADSSPSEVTAGCDYHLSLRSDRRLRLPPLARHDLDPPHRLVKPLRGHEEVA